MGRVISPYGGSEYASEDNKYRYLLTRILEDVCEKPMTATFIGLNPNKADSQFDEPTITKCIGFAKRIGCNRIAMVNLYAYRASSPDELFKAALLDDIIGPDNFESIHQAMQLSRIVIACWGASVKDSRHVAKVYSLADLTGKKLYCLGTNNDGSPTHPLLVPYKKVLQEYYTPQCTCNPHDRVYYGCRCMAGKGVQ